MTSTIFGDDFFFPSSPSGTISELFSFDVPPEERKPDALQTLFTTLLQKQSLAAVKQFVEEVKVLRLPLHEYERYLSALETARIIKADEKLKKLFIHAAALQMAERAEQYLRQGNIESLDLLQELLALENPPEQAIRYLCQNGVNLPTAMATIPHLVTLLQVGISPYLINLESKPAIDWAFSTNNAFLIQEVIKGAPQLAIAQATNPEIVAYFKRRYAKESCPPPFILTELCRLGARPGNLQELLEFAAQYDDESLIKALLQAEPVNEWINGQPPLNIVCRVPQANRAIVALFELGANPFVEDSQKRTAFDLLLSSKSAAIRELLLHPSLLRKPLPLDKPLQALKNKRIPKELLLFFAHLLVSPQAALYRERLLQPVNSDRQTLLHLAAKEQVVELVKALVPFIDVHALDIHKRPALYYALSPLNLAIALTLLKAGAKPFHLADRLNYYCFVVQLDHYDLVVGSNRLWQMRTTQPLHQHMSENAYKFPFDALEFTFLIPSLTPPYKAYPNKERYLEDLLKLKNRYSTVPLEYFYPFLLLLDKTHLLRKIAEIEIPPVTEPVDIKELLTVFDKLNWSDPQAENYCDPEQVRVMGQVKNKKNLRDALEGLLTRHVPNREFYTGTPAMGSPMLLAFYEKLENTLKHLTRMLTQEQNPKRRTKAILKLAWSTLLCGTRWEEMSVRLYAKIKLGTKRYQFLEDAFDKSLDDLRESVARNIVSQDVHAYRQLVRAVGHEYNLTLKEGIANVNELCQRRQYTPEFCQFMYRTSYTATLIIPQVMAFFKESIRNNDGSLLQWVRRRHAPDTYRLANLEELSAAIGAIPLFYSDPAEQRAALQQLIYKKTATYIGRNQLPADLNADPILEQIRADEYFDTNVYSVDSDTFFNEGYIHFLSERKVLQETFPGIFVDFMKACKEMPHSTMRTGL